MNPSPPNVVLGTMGELLVQLQLLRFGVQAAPPLIDSGNDLVALRGRAIRTIQVKTSQQKRKSFRKLPGLYDLLAIVIYDPAKMADRNCSTFRWDDMTVYLFAKEDYDRRTMDYSAHELSEDLINRYWPTAEGSPS